MNKIKRFICLILSVILVVGTLAGCSSSKDNIDFIYPFNAKIRSFDPQVASTADEFLIIENCFEGLVRVLDDGTVKPAVAESWSISDDGLTYTFKLMKGIKWNIDTSVDDEGNRREDKRLDLVGYDFNPDVTADDFVFALQRAADPNTDCPLFSSIANIKNASKVHTGKLPVTALGVTAVDDYTLEIKLASPDDSFLSIMSTAVAMPCNERFFNATKGRYGLAAKYTLFNGQFYVSSILDASYILDNNKLYTGSTPSKVANITLNIINPESEIPKKLKSGYYDSAFISGEEYEALNDSTITTVAYSNKMWAFVFNKNRPLFSNKYLRQGVCLSVSDIDLSEYSYLDNATGFTPQSCLIGSENAVKAIGTTVITPDANKAQKCWKKGLEEEGFTIANIKVITTENMYDITKKLVQGIQGTIGQITSYGDNGKISFALKIDVLSQEDFNTAISKGEYDIALYPFEASTQNAVSYLNDIINGNFMGQVDEVERALKTAQSSPAASLVKACKNCEKEMMNDYSILPIMFESSFYAQAKGVSGVQFHPGSGRVCFVYADRKD